MAPFASAVPFRSRVPTPACKCCLNGPPVARAITRRGMGAAAGALLTTIVGKPSDAWALTDIGITVDKQAK
jgi:hypothetical protein